MSINFDRAADYYDETRGYPSEVAGQVGQALADAAGATEHTRFLEIGIGTGRLALPVLALGYDYTGVDISERMLARLREKLAALGGSEKLALQVADMHALPFADQQFDAVIAAHVFHLVADPHGALREALRVLRPGGVLLVCFDSQHGTESLSVNEAWRQIVRETYGPIPNSAEAADRLLRELGMLDPTLEIDELRPVHWTYTTTVAGAVEQIRLRRWSNTWILPDTVFERCLTRLNEWCIEHVGPEEMTRPLPRQADFVIRRIRRAPSA